MGLTLTSDERGVKVYRKDKTSKNGNAYTTYSIMTSTKDGDEWINGFLDVVFKKGTEITNKTVIKIEEAFPLVSQYEGKTYIKWFIKEYKVLAAGEAPAAPVDEFVNVPENIQEELPFARPIGR